MPNVPDGKALANFLLPEELELRVKDHWHSEKLSSKTAAYIDLLERGLKQAAKEKAPRE